MVLQAMLPQDSVLPGGRVLPWYYRLCYHRIVYCQGVGVYHGTTGYVITG